jgi:hypothetical protein
MHFSSGVLALSFAHMIVDVQQSRSMQSSGDDPSKDPPSLRHNWGSLLTPDTLRHEKTHHETSNLWTQHAGTELRKVSGSGKVLLES